MEKRFLVRQANDFFPKINTGTVYSLLRFCSTKQLGFSPDSGGKLFPTEADAFALAFDHNSALLNPFGL